MARRTGLSAVLPAAAAVVCVACSPDQEPAPGQQLSAPVPGEAPLPDQPVNTLGSNTEFQNLSLLNVYATRPAGDRYEPGQDGRVRLTLVNRGATDDALVAARSPAAAAVEIRWDRACDGTAEQVDRLPVLAGGGVPPLNGASPLRHGPYYLGAAGFTREVLAGTMFPLTVTFERAGEVTVPVLVQGDQPRDTPAAPDCLGDR